MSDISGRQTPFLAGRERRDYAGDGTLTHVTGNRAAPQSANQAIVNVLYGTLESTLANVSFTMPSMSLLDVPSGCRGASMEEAGFKRAPAAAGQPQQSFQRTPAARRQLLLPDGHCRVAES